GETVRTAPLPGPRRRHPDEVDPEAERADEALRQVTQLLDGLRAVAEGIAQPLGVRAQCSLGRERPDPSHPFLPGPADTVREQPVLATRDDVDRRAHERRLDEAPVLERPGQVVTLEPG